MIHPIEYASTLKSVLLNDRRRCQILAHVRDLALPDCWIGAGFIRDAIWDLLSGYEAGEISNDVDVIWFDTKRILPELDVEIEQRLIGMDPITLWSVKNQSRMHRRNGDEPYASCVHALSFWPETATAVAARLTQSNEIEILAPFGLEDLLQGIIRPTPRFRQGKLDVFEQRWREKEWLKKWPILRVTVD